MITVTYFGNLKDQLQCVEETIAWESGDTEILLAQLRERGDIWETALAPEKVFRVVVNEEITFAPTEITAGDRVALLPPVTGG
ncbi:MoaD/ThiS family protein [Ignatzschineria sp. LJL83]